MNEQDPDPFSHPLGGPSIDPIVMICIIIAMFIGLAVGLPIAFTVIGTAVEVIAQHHEDRDRCLKQATNGYDIEQCR